MITLEETADCSLSVLLQAWVTDPLFQPCHLFE